MFNWEKLGKVFDPLQYQKFHWLNEFAQAPATLVFDDFVRIYFSCRPKPDSKGQYVSYSAFIDVSRTNIFDIIRISDNPIMKLGEKGTFDEFGTYPVSVIKDGDLIRAYYGGWTRCESVPFNVAIGCAESIDNGVTFQKVGKGPICSYSPDEPFILSGPKIRKFNGKWMLFYIAGRRWIKGENIPEPVYKIRMAESDDGFVWHKRNTDLINDILDINEAQASPDVFFWEGKYHMFFCYRHGLGYRSKEKGYRIGYAYSEDLYTWIRDDSKAGIDISDEGWDSEMISYPHVFELDGKIYLLYLGNQVGRYGFGLAVLKD